jgi:hypothetical protein
MDKKLNGSSDFREAVMRRKDQIDNGPSLEFGPKPCMSDVTLQHHKPSFMAERAEKIIR